MNNYVGQRVYCTDDKNIKSFVQKNTPYTVVSIKLMGGVTALEIIDDFGNRHFLNAERFVSVLSTCVRKVPRYPTEPKDNVVYRKGWDI